MNAQASDPSAQQDAGAAPAFTVLSVESGPVYACWISGDVAPG